MVCFIYQSIRLDVLYRKVYKIPWIFFFGCNSLFFWVLYRNFLGSKPLDPKLLFFKRWIFELIRLHREITWVSNSNLSSIITPSSRADLTNGILMPLIVTWSSVGIVVLGIDWVSVYLVSHSDMITRSVFS